MIDVCWEILGFWFFLLFFGVTVKPEAPNKAPIAGGSGFNQILGIKGAKQETVSD